MKRDTLQKLIRWKEKDGRKPLLLRGVRQAGKTFLLKGFGNSYFRQTHYLNFEENEELAALFTPNLTPQRIIHELQFYLGVSVDVERDLVIFDEIQECPRALTSLKYFAENMPELALCSAGSLLGIHLNSGGSFPVGKVDMLNLYPMSFREFLVALGDNKSLPYLEIAEQIPEIVHRHLWERLKWYFVVGGLPEVVKTFCNYQENLFEAFQAVRTKQNEIIQAYQADIAKHAGKINAMHIERIWKNVPNQLEKPQDGTAKKFTFADVVPGIDRYSRLVGAIDWLEKAELIIKAHIVETGSLPFAAYAKENTFKLFLVDVGLLGAMTKLTPKVILHYDYGSYKGYFAENFVAQEFLCAGAGPLHSWQKKKAEVEFLLEFDGEAIPVEVKSGWVTKAKSIYKFKEKYQSPYCVILSANNLSINKATHRYPLYLAGSLGQGNVLKREL